MNDVRRQFPVGTNIDHREDFEPPDVPYPGGWRGGVVRGHWGSWLLYTDANGESQACPASSARVAA